MEKINDEGFNAWCSCGKYHRQTEHDIVTAANLLQEAALTRTTTLREQEICEVCNGPHPTYKCCEDCNYVRHVCKACGEDLGHSEISTCYLLHRLGIY